MAMDAIDFASLLCSRLCHDLLSPVGALNNGIELLADEHDPEMRGKVLELLSDSARASANKLKFFRLAFGAAVALATRSMRARQKPRSKAFSAPAGGSSSAGSWATPPCPSQRSSSS